MATGRPVATESRDNWKILQDRKFNVKLGQSFTDKERHAFHTIAYDFKPKSIGKSKPAKLKVDGEGVEVAVPSAQPGPGNVDDSTVFRGSMNQATKECILSLNLHTGEAVLERVTNRVLLKVVRDRKGRGAGKDRPVSPAAAPLNSVNITPNSFPLSKVKKANNKGKQPPGKKRTAEATTSSLQPQSGIEPSRKEVAEVNRKEMAEVNRKEVAEVNRKEVAEVNWKERISPVDRQFLSAQPWRQLEMPQKRSPSHTLSSLSDTDSSSDSDSEPPGEMASLPTVSAFRPVSPVPGQQGRVAQRTGVDVMATDPAHRQSSSSSSDSESTTSSSSSGSSRDGSEQMESMGMPPPPALAEHRSMSILKDELGLSSSDSD